MVSEALQNIDKKSLKDYTQDLKDAPVIYINPIDAVNRRSTNKYKPIVKQLNWDKLGTSILDSTIFKSFKLRLSGTKWESTGLYKQRKAKKKPLAKFPYWEQMLFDIVENGYSFRPLKEDPIDEYMSILIGRNGHLFIYNGIHRFCSCLLSKKPKKIPVKVLYRHPEWEAFRNKCLSYAKRKNQLYCQMPHPDLEQIPYKWTNERAELITKHSNFPGGKLVDIGAHWGTISYTLAQNNFDVLAIEKNLIPFKFLDKVSKFPGKSFKVTNKDFTPMKITADTLVMLNIAHHFIINTGCCYADNMSKKFVRFLNNLDVKEIFYQAHDDNSKWAKHIKPTTYLNLINKKSKKTKIKKLKNFNGRILYHLT